MSPFGTGRRPLPDLHPGMSRLAQLFPPAVRLRGLRYYDGHKVEVVTADERLSAAVVLGSDTYDAAFELREDSVLYRCTCPYFFEGGKPCKHLWALVLEAATSNVILAADRVGSVTPHPEYANASRSPFVSEWEPSRRPGWPLRVVAPAPSERLIDAPPWHLIVHEVATRSRGVEPGLREPLYFIELQPSAAGDVPFTMYIAERSAKGPRRGAIRPFRDFRVETLSDVKDRELALLLAPNVTRDPATHVHVHQRAAAFVLTRAVATGRCRLAPPHEGSTADAWRAFRSGASDPRRPAADAGQALIELAPLTLDDEEYRLELALQRADGNPARLRVEATLTRRNERRGLAEVKLVLDDGWLIFGGLVARCRRADALWIDALRTQPAPSLPESQVATFLRDARHVSAVHLPADYELVGGAPPQCVLELGTPRSRGIPANVRFEYGSVRVAPGEPGELTLISDRRVLRRHRAAERAALVQLGELGFEGELAANNGIADAHLFIKVRRLLGGIRSLLATGWIVLDQGRRYREPSRFDVRVSSGIDWLQLEGSASFDDQTIELPALLARREREDPRVPLPDGSIGLLPEGWSDRYASLTRYISSSDVEALRFRAHHLGVVRALLSMLPGDAGREAFGQLRGRLDSFVQSGAADPPASFEGTLRHYQREGLGWLLALCRLNFGACLADDMGLGKTIQVLAFLATRVGAASAPSLIVVPRSLVFNWVDEARRFAPTLRIHLHWGKERQPHVWPEADLILTTYATLRQDVDALVGREFDCVVLDEAQAIKNINSRTSKAVGALRGSHKIALTGTPVENHLGELWSLFEFLNPGLVASLPRLKQALSKPKPDDAAQELIRHAVRPFILRRTKAEVAPELPERSEQMLYAEPGREERARYSELLHHYRDRLREAAEELGPEGASAMLFEALLRMRQAACHPGLIDEQRRGESSAKLDVLLERLASVTAEGHKALVFSQFVGLLTIVRQRLDEAQVAYEYLDGSTVDRSERVERFQNDPGISVFLLSLKAGGVGLNLTAADYVFILDPWWNPAVEAQAIDRAHRIGQTRPVIAYRLLTRDTVEQRVLELQQQKRQLASAILEPGGLSQPLSRADLEQLLELVE